MYLKLDLPTLLVVSTIASVSLAAAVLIVARRAKVHQGLSLWGIGLLFNALSYPVFGLRAFGWVQTSILMTNLLTGLTLVLHILALSSFQRSKVVTLPRWLVWSSLGVNMALASLLLNNDPLRNVLVAFVQSIMALMLCREAWAPKLNEKRLTGRLVVFAGSALLFLALIARTAFMVSTSDWEGRYNVPDQVQAGTYAVVFAVLLINSMGFVLMQMERAIAEQRNLANRDQLTGLYNRYALMDALELQMAQSRRTQLPLALLMFDVDNFKSVNDQRGHLVGDRVLREVAQRIQRRLRQSDLVARYGGEEFLALLPATDEAGAVTVAEAIRRAIESQPVVVDQGAITVTVSVGAHSSIPLNEGTEAEVLIGLSDQALYRAKESGKNAVFAA